MTLHMSLLSLRSLSSPQTMFEDTNDVPEDDYTTLVAVTSVVIGSLSLLMQQYSNMAEEDKLIMQYVLPPLHRSSVNWYYAVQRVHRQRQKWATFKRDLTDRQFRRYFRMSKCLFQHDGPRR